MIFILNYQELWYLRNKYYDKSEAIHASANHVRYACPMIKLSYLRNKYDISEAIHASANNARCAYPAKSIVKHQYKGSHHQKPVSAIEKICQRKSLTHTTH